MSADVSCYTRKGMMTTSLQCSGLFIRPEKKIRQGSVLCNLCLRLPDFFFTDMLAAAAFGRLHYIFHSKEGNRVETERPLRRARASRQMGRRQASITGLHSTSDTFTDIFILRAFRRRSCGIVCSAPEKSRCERS